MKNFLNKIFHFSEAFENTKKKKQKIFYKTISSLVVINIGERKQYVSK